MASPAQAAPKPELWDIWTRHDPASIVRVDHMAWDDLLRHHVQRTPDGRNVVRYAAFDAADRAALDAYVEMLVRTSVSGLSRGEQKVYWINLYNALTVQLVLRHYPVKTIRDTGGGFFSPGPWRDKLVRIEGSEVSLDDIEHRILRPIWRDPLVHYALNCAASGCPDLQDRAFTADNCDDLLAQAATAYVNHPRGVRVSGDSIEVSSIYDWYGSDFGAGQAGLLRHLAQYAAPDLRARLTNASTVDYQSYDWSLNDAGG